MSGYVYTVPAKVKVLERGNVRLKIRAEASKESDSNAHGFTAPSSIDQEQQNHVSAAVGLKIQKIIYRNSSCDWTKV